MYRRRRRINRERSASFLSASYSGFVTTMSNKCVQLTLKLALLSLVAMIGVLGGRLPFPTPIDKAEFGRAEFRVRSSAESRPE